ncbi:RMD1 family protein [Lacinutrix sp. C3R15]|uniref:RMD1 family protein n=1 Tax=Flavobacteriaceae TaxID=49546 RepID=UPI001C098D5D|nr:MULTISPECIES: RMD1 family protein [Flavobacteriaceae]MBU2939136.1 RMD1 family protein [Lacinutrix sp. C3R15]MDO6622452.1 RMD1 family protein [Oceanihabitans sp. 1_MG-2023]
MYTVVAYQVANTIHIKASKQQLQWQLLFQDSDELFYKSTENKYIYIFQYGMVSFFNMNASEIAYVLERLKPFCDTYISEKISEDMQIEVKENSLQVEFDKVILPELNDEMIRLVMLNASQSVALDRYADITQELLIETHEHTKYLENKGKLDISGNKLKRFIGKVLNIKNKISENLYIFDSPDSTWENEQLNKLNQELKIAFDLKDRYRLIHDRIEIIKENLELFKDIMDHKESSKLEWIIIILIVIEVVDMFIAKIFF